MISQSGLEDAQQVKFTYCCMPSIVPTSLKFTLIYFFHNYSQSNQRSFCEKKDRSKPNQSAEGLEETQLL